MSIGTATQPDSLNGNARAHAYAYALSLFGSALPSLRVALDEFEGQPTIRLNPRRHRMLMRLSLTQHLLEFLLYPGR
jgi:hypothetical protein